MAISFRRLKQAVRRVRLKRLGVFEEATIEKVILGSGGGAWTAGLEGIVADSVIYSFGAGTDISFDLDIHRRTGAAVHIFDPTPRSIEWMATQRLPDGVIFHDYGIGDVDGEIMFHPPRRDSSSHFSPLRRYGDRQFGEPVTAPVFTIRSIMEKLGHGAVNLIKLDIEGGEFEVVADLVAPEVGARQLLIEFHHNYAGVPVTRTAQSVETLRSAGFKCFHLSQRTYEMSFIREAGPVPGMAAATSTGETG